MSDVVKQRIYDGLVELLPDWESRARSDPELRAHYRELMLAICGERVNRIAENELDVVIPCGAIWVSDEPPTAEEVDGFREAMITRGK